jgi:hypothetical protein
MQSLPTELLFRIVLDVDCAKDVYSLSQTCRSLRDVSTSPMARIMWYVKYGNCYQVIQHFPGAYEQYLPELQKMYLKTMAFFLWYGQYDKATDFWKTLAPLQQAHVMASLVDWYPYPNMLKWVYKMDPSFVQPIDLRIPRQTVSEDMAQSLILVNHPLVHLCTRKLESMIQDGLGQGWVMALTEQDVFQLPRMLVLAIQYNQRSLVESLIDRFGRVSVLGASLLETCSQLENHKMAEVLIQLGARHGCPDRLDKTIREMLQKAHSKERSLRRRAWTD